MSKRIAILGLSGVGKSTLIGKVRQAMPLLHLQASELIKAEQAYRSQNPDSSEGLRTGAVLDNQALLISAFLREAAATTLPIVFDGHSLIDGPNGLIEIPSSVFEELNLDAICYLAADPMVIAERRQADTRRERPYRDTVALQQHQELAEAAARRVARNVGCPFLSITDSKINILYDLISQVHP